MAKLTLPLSVVFILSTALIFLIWLNNTNTENVVEASLETTLKDRSWNSTLDLTSQSSFSSNEDSGFVSGLENLPPSFSGTQPDGQLVADSSGNLIISHQVRLTFDYFLTGIGEEPIDILIARIRAYIANQLPEPAASQANRLLEDYLALQEALSKLDMPSNSRRLDTEKMSRLLEEVISLRRTYLSPEVAEAFYAEEESYDRYSLQAANILQDQTLSNTEQEKQINYLKQQLPETMQTAMTETQKVVDMNRSVQQLKKDGGNKIELYNLRSEYVGPEAAERLAKLDEERAQWKDQLETWFALRNKIRQDQSIAEQDKAGLTDQLRSDYFEKKDIHRVQALERIHDNKHPQS